MRKKRRKKRRRKRKKRRKRRRKKSKDFLDNQPTTELFTIFFVFLRSSKQFVRPAANTHWSCYFIKHWEQFFQPIPNKPLKQHHEQHLLTNSSLVDSVIPVADNATMQSVRELVLFSYRPVSLLIS